MCQSHGCPAGRPGCYQPHDHSQRLTLGPVRVLSCWGGVESCQRTVTWSMIYGGPDQMKLNLSRTLTRPAFWAGTALQLVMTAQIWVALQVALNPGTTFRDHLWPSGAVFAVVITVSTLISPLLMKAVLKDDDSLSDEQTAALDLALRTGVLPLASLFADWGPTLRKRRRDLVSSRWLGPILAAGLIALNIYDSLVDPDGAWFYWVSALFYAVLTVTGEVTVRRRFRHVRALEHQVEELRGRVPLVG